MSLKVDTESIFAASESLQRVGAVNGQLALRLGPIAAQVTAVLGLDPSGQGAAAAATLGRTALDAGAVSAGNFVLGQNTRLAAEAYEQAEEISAQLLAQAKLHTPEVLYSLSYLFDRLKDRETGNPVTSVVLFSSSWVLSRVLFGAGTYLDIKLNGREFAARRAQEKAEKFGYNGSIRHDVGKWLGNELGALGLYRNLAKDSVTVRELDPDKATTGPEKEQAERAQEFSSSLGDISSLAHNMSLANQNAGLTDAVHSHDTRWIEQDGITFQLIYDENGQIAEVAAYLPGTDDDSFIPLSGSVSGWLDNGNTIDVDTHRSIAESSAYLQLLDEGLTRLGITSDIPLTLAGFSQGGLVATVASTNEEFRSKYNVTRLYTAGSPNGDMPMPTDVEVTVVRDVSDRVPGLQGTTMMPTWGDNVNVIITDYKAEHPEVEGMAVHNADYYAASVAALAPQKQEDKAQEERDSKVFAVDGSTWSPDTSQTTARVYAAGSVLMGGYEIVEELGELSPLPPLQALPDIPESFDYTATFNEYIQPVLEEINFTQEPTDVPDTWEEYRYIEPQIQVAEEYALAAG